MRRVMFAALALACSNEGELVPDGDGLVTDPTNPTEMPTTPPSEALGPAVVVDDLHIASLLEDAHAFSLLGAFVDPLLQQQVDAGTLLLGLELRDVDDPTFVADDDMSVGLYLLTDTDGDPADNFDPDAPETFELGPGAFIDDEPALHFTDADLVGGQFDAAGLDALDLLGDALPLPLSNLEVSGQLSVVDGHVRTVEDGRLRGVVGMSLLALTPNLLGDTCAGASLLDVLATGCGLFGVQPDADVDGDGLERLFDDDDDGSIDRCIDGDGTEILGTECPSDPRMADGYTLIFVVHGVRAELVVP